MSLRFSLPYRKLSGMVGILESSVSEIKGEVFLFRTPCFGAVSLRLKPFINVFISLFLAVKIKLEGVLLVFRYNLRLVYYPLLAVGG